MRRVFRKRGTEPAVLRGNSIRAAYADLVDFYRLTASDRNRRRAPVQRNIYSSKEVVNALSAVFLSKCAYCESTVGIDDFPDVSHHRPIGSAVGLGRTQHDAQSPDHYGWLAYEWNNLFLACRECNRAKQNLFPLKGPRARIRSTWREAEESEDVLLINPCRMDPRKHLTFGIDGRVYPKDQVGFATIHVLELNRDSLVNARVLKFAKCVNALEKMRHAPGERNRLVDELEDVAPYAGAAQIAMFDLLNYWCRNAGLARPTVNFHAKRACPNFCVNGSDFN